MTNKDKIKLLEEMLELEDGKLSEDTELVDIEEWDSMAAISLIVLMDEHFGKQLTGTQIKEFKIVKDIVEYMG